VGFLDTLKSWGDDITKEAKKFANKSLMEGTVAACAMVAQADGTVDPEEKQKIIAYMSRSEALQVYDIPKVIESFQKYLEGYDFDKHIGEGECMKAIQKIASKPDEARLLVRVCCAIGAADGNFDDDEKAVVRKICSALNLPPSEFDL